MLRGVTPVDSPLPIDSYSGMSMENADPPVRRRVWTGN